MSAACGCSCSRRRTFAPADGSRARRISSRSGIPISTNCSSSCRASSPRCRSMPELVDVTTDREQNGLQANVVIDRDAASRLGVRVQDIDNALNNAFSQRQVSTIYAERNQYRVILEVDPLFQRDPSDLTQVYVAGNGSTQVPLSSVARIEKTLAPLVINHQGLVPGRHHHLQHGAEHPDRSRSAAITKARGRAAPAGHAASGVRRRRQGLSALGRRAADGDPGGACWRSTSFSACCTRAWRIR